MRFYVWGYVLVEIKFKCLLLGVDEFVYYFKNGVWDIIDFLFYI